MFQDMRTQLERLRTRRKALLPSGEGARDTRLLSFYSRIMNKVVDAERCSVFIHDPGKDTVWLMAGTGLEEKDIEVPKEGSIAGRVIHTGEPILESGLDSKHGVHRELENKTNFVTRSIMCVPIKSPVRNEITGAFQLLNKIGADGFGADDLIVANEIAEHLQVEVDRIFLDQEIFGLTEKLYSAVHKGAVILLGTVVSLIAIAALALLVYVALPAIMG